MGTSRLLRVGMLFCLVASMGILSNWACGTAPPDGEEKAKEQVIHTEKNNEKTGSEFSDGGQKEPAPDVRSPEPVVEISTSEQAPDAHSPDLVTTPDEIVKPAIITPTSLTTVSAPTTSWTLPATVKNDPVLHFSLLQTTVLFGGRSGLYRIKKKMLTRISQMPVVGLASWGAGKVVVATAKGIFLWDDKTLAPTRFMKSLKGQVITTLRYQTENTFWIGTNHSLWLYQKDTLLGFGAIKGVKSLLSLASKKLLVVEDLKGQFFALQENGGKWLLRSFGPEGVKIKGLTPQNNAKLNFWGIDDQKDLWLRKVSGTDAAAWWMYRLKPNKDDKETVGIKKMFYQKKTGQTWVVGTNMLYRLSEGEAGMLKRPDSLKSIVHIGSTNDGALWFSDGVKLVRVGEQKTQAVSYQKQIAPIMKKYCTRCHSASSRKQQPLFDTYAQVKAKSSRIITRMEQPSGFMPPGGNRVPATERGLIKAWIAGKHQP